MTIQTFLDNIVLMPDNKLYKSLYYKIVGKIIKEYMNFNKSLKEEKNNYERNLANKKTKEIIQIYDDVIYFEKEYFNPYFNESKLSVYSIKVFFEFIKDYINGYYQSSPDKIIELCDYFEEMYSKQEKFYIAKNIQKDKIKELINDKLARNKITSALERIKFAKTDEEKQKIIEKLPFKTDLNNFEKDFENYFKKLDIRESFGNKNKDLIQNVLEGKESYEKLEKEINNFINQLETKIIQTTDKNEKELIKLQIESLKDFKTEVENSFTEGAIQEKLKEEIKTNIKNIEKNFGEHIDKEIFNNLKEALKTENKEKIEKEYLNLIKTFKTLKNVPDIDKKLLENIESQTITLTNIYKHSLEKDKKEQLEKNIEKAKNVELDDKKIKTYAKDEYDLKVKKSEEKDEEKFSTLYDLAYKQTQKLSEKTFDFAKKQIDKTLERTGIKSKYENAKLKLAKFKDDKITPILNKIETKRAALEYKINDIINNPKQLLENKNTNINNNKLTNQLKNKLTFKLLEDLSKSFNKKIFNTSNENIANTDKIPAPIPFKNQDVSLPFDSKNIKFSTQPISINTENQNSSFSVENKKLSIPNPFQKLSFLFKNISFPFKNKNISVSVENKKLPDNVSFKNQDKSLPFDNKNIKFSTQSIPSFTENQNLPFSDENKKLPDYNEPINIDNNKLTNIIEKFINFFNPKGVATQSISKGIVNQNIKVPKVTSSKNPFLQALSAIANELGIISFIEKQEYLDTKRSSNVKEYDLGNFGKNNQNINQNKKENIFKKIPKKDENDTSKSKFSLLDLVKKPKNLMKIGAKALTGAWTAYNVGKQVAKDIHNENLKDDERGIRVIGAATQALSFGLLDSKTVNNTLVDTVDKWKNFFTTGSFNSGKAEEERKEWHLNKEWEIYQRKDPNAMGVTTDKVVTKTKDGKFLFKTKNNTMYMYDTKRKTWVIFGKAIPNSVEARKIILGLQTKNKKLISDLKYMTPYPLFSKHPIENKYLRFIISNPSLYKNGNLTQRGELLYNKFIKSGKIDKKDIETFNKFYLKKNTKNDKKQEIKINKAKKLQNNKNIKDNSKQIQNNKLNQKVENNSQNIQNNSKENNINENQNNSKQKVQKINKISNIKSNIKQKLNKNVKINTNNENLNIESKSKLNNNKITNINMKKDVEKLHLKTNKEDKKVEEKPVIIPQMSSSGGTNITNIINQNWDSSAIIFGML